MISTCKELSSRIFWFEISVRIGASFTGFTTSVNIVLSDNSPSLMVTVILTSPLKSETGVIVSWFPSISKLVSPSTAE